MRTFIAVELPGTLKKQLGTLAASLSTSQVEAKWVDPANLHITLKFLGEVTEEELPAIISVLEKLGQSHNRFTVKTAGFGCFPPRGKPRVLFVETVQQRFLQALAAELEERLADLGFAKEGRFKAHITLARFKGAHNLPRLKQQLETVELNEVFTVAALTLYKSTLNSRGPSYQVLHVAKLKAAR
ncbi:MAG: RNA 2',3'-cyclic phosphodiesterase [Deltaproteobacteria bacterium]|nr:RNA 2',3'-cyclic phosphodiesterase [Deltaproteobacteria bacterium]MCW9050280.1 RNA 2',3'-cyclic phosphodiesterase [Deltaproteobacteria bacterium]